MDIRPMVTDVVVGASCVAAAAAVTTFVMTSVITPDDGLEALMALPISAALLAVVSLLRTMRLDAAAAMGRTGLAAAGGVAAWACVGGAIGATQQAVNPLLLALSAALVPGGFAFTGALVGFILGRVAAAARRGNGVTRPETPIRLAPPGGRPRA